jgi:hypothetical protein
MQLYRPSIMLIINKFTLVKMSLFREGSTDDIYPQPVSKKIIIDPEKLIKMRQQRQPFKMVKSRFEPD